MKSAYLVNIYPRVSHTFIRREILALEAAGVPVERYSIRPCDTPLVDETDKVELTKTRVITKARAGMLFATLRAMLATPGAFLTALSSAIKMGRHSDRGLLVHLAYLAEACLLRRWLTKSRICHLHAHHGTNSAAVAMLCRQLGGPEYSFTVHGPEEFERAPTLALDKKVAMAQFVVAISEFGKGQLIRWSEPGDWKKFRIVRCGVDDRFLTTAPLSPVPSKPRLVCVGRLCVEKGQMVLIEAARILQDKRIEFELVLAGDGPLRPRLEQRINEAGLQQRVRITGWLSSQQVKEEMLASRALVLPSFAEGLPVVIMEALALGRPVISTPVAGIPELLQTGVNGWLVQPGSAEQLAAAMMEALTAPVEALARMGSAGAQAVAQRHNAASEAGKLRHLFEHGLNGHHVNGFSKGNGTH
jgi:glycosyltransferase involved in cell wall biosynthesis